MTSSSCMMMSEPIEFWSDMECSGVSNLWEIPSQRIWSRQNGVRARVYVHWTAIMRTQESNTFFRDLC